MVKFTLFSVFVLSLQTFGAVKGQRPVLPVPSLLQIRVRSLNPLLVVLRVLTRHRPPVEYSCSARSSHRQVVT